MAGLHAHDGAFSTVDANKDGMTGSDECLKAHAQEMAGTAQRIRGFERCRSQCPYAPEGNLPMFVKSQI
jgi:hypothetical protein